MDSDIISFLFISYCDMLKVQLIKYLKHIFTVPTLISVAVKSVDNSKSISKLLEIISCYPEGFRIGIWIVGFKRISYGFGYLFQL